MSPKRSSLDFTDLVLPPDPLPTVQARVGQFRGKDGAVRDYDFSAYPASPLLNALIEAAHTVAGRSRLKRRVGWRLVRAAHALFEAFESLGTSATPQDLTVTHIDTAAMAVGPTLAFHVTNIAKTMGPAILHPDTWKRLQWILPEGVTVEYKPREPYSDAEWTRIREVCLTRIEKTYARLERGRDLLRLGRDPRGGTFTDWARTENLVWLANEVGPLNRVKLAELGVGRNRLRYLQSKYDAPVLPDVNALLYPTSDDIFPHTVLFLGLTGIPQSPAEDLTICCMERLANNRFTIRYIKARARDKEIRMRYRDGPIDTPGGIIRRVITITERLRVHFPSEALWLAVEPAGPQPDRVVKVRPLDLVRVRGNRIPDFRRDVGIPDFTLARLRKTWVANNTKAAKAQFTPIVMDHTPAVHVEHYAKMKRLLPVHYEIVHDLLTSEREITVQATVLTSDEEVAAMEAAPGMLGDRMGCSAQVAREALNGTLDLWMNACTGFYNSPFAKPGQPCGGAPLGLCLDCPNGLITPAKLPAIYTYLNHIVSQREVVPAEQWKDAFGKIYERLVFGILRQFPDSVLLEARAKAEADAPLPFLGPELRSFAHLTP